MCERVCVHALLQALNKNVLLHCMRCKHKQIIAFLKNVFKNLVVKTRIHMEPQKYSPINLFCIASSRA